MSQDKPDEQPEEKLPQTPPDEIKNPYSSPKEDHGLIQEPKRSLPVVIMSTLGMIVAIFLLVVVVGFGLLLGCCALGVR